MEDSDARVSDVEDISAGRRDPDRTAEPPDFRGWVTAVIALIWSILVISGGVALVSGDAGSSSSSDLCANSRNVAAGMGLLWLVWFVLALLTLAAVVAGRRRFPNGRRCRVIARVGEVSTIVLFPLWLSIGTAFNCAL